LLSSPMSPSCPKKTRMNNSFGWTFPENIENDPEWKWPDENDLSMKIILS
jgi:hypothetical protein